MILRAAILCLLGSPGTVIRHLLHTATLNWQPFGYITIYEQHLCPYGVVDTINLQAVNPGRPGLTRFTNDGIQVEVDSAELEFAGTIYNVILHELGHVLGFEHPEPPDSSIMSYRLPRTPKDDPYRVIRPDVWPAVQSNMSIRH